MSRGQGEAGSVTGTGGGRQCHGERGVAVVAGSGRGGAGSDRELQPVAEGWQGAEAAGSDRRVGKWKAVQEVFFGGGQRERDSGKVWQPVVLVEVMKKTTCFRGKRKWIVRRATNNLEEKTTLRVSCIAKRKEERTSIWTHHIRRSRNMPTEIVKIHV